MKVYVCARVCLHTCAFTHMRVHVLGSKLACLQRDKAIVVPCIFKGMIFNS